MAFAVVLVAERFDRRAHESYYWLAIIIVRTAATNLADFMAGDMRLPRLLVMAGLAVLLVQAKWIERSLFPFAVILQVTPLVAIAPLLLIWVKDVRLALVLCAFLVAFFPVAANTTLGLQSADHHLLDLMRLYGASRWQVLRFIRLPSALPYFLGGLRISGGLALIGAVVAEFVAGTGGAASGLAYRILEAGYTLAIPRMFAALVLLAGSGVFLYALLSALTHLLLRRWHGSAVRRELPR